MKIIVAFLILFTSLQLQAQSKTVEAAQKIKVLSQKYANDYLFLYYNPNHFKYLPKLHSSIKDMEKNLRIIAKDTQNEDTRSILDYLSYTKDELKELLDEEIDRDNTQKVLDATDSLVEGVESILQNRDTKIFKESLKYHIMRLSKLYMAIHLKFDQEENREKLTDEIKIVEQMVQNLNQNIYVSWHAYKRLFLSPGKYFIPHIVSIAVDDLLESVDNL